MCVLYVFLCHLHRFMFRLLLLVVLDVVGFLLYCALLFVGLFLSSCSGRGGPGSMFPWQIQDVGFIIG